MKITFSCIICLEFGFIFSVYWLGNYDQEESYISMFGSLSCFVAD